MAERVHHLENRSPQNMSIGGIFGCAPAATRPVERTIDVCDVQVDADATAAEGQRRLAAHVGELLGGAITIESPILTFRACMTLPSGPSMRVTSSAPKACL